MVITVAVLVSILALMVISNLVGWTKFVVSTTNKFTYLEADGIINLRLGAFHVCWGTSKALERRWGKEWWNPFPVFVEFWRPVPQWAEDEGREAFRIGCRWVNALYRTRGNTKLGDWYYLETGWKLKGTAPEFIRDHGFWKWFWGWVPMRVWRTDSPMGGGPWAFSPEEAADFLTNESAEDEDGQVTFTDEQLRRLWMPGRCASQGEWSIKCIIIPRWQNVLEWDGW